MPTLHQSPHQTSAGSPLDSRGFRRQVFALLRLSGAFSQATAPRTRGHAGSHHQARGQTHSRANRASHWPSGCGLSLTEQELAIECSGEPMSWEA